MKSLPTKKDAKIILEILYAIDGIVFSSVQEACKHYKIDPSTFYKRLARGMNTYAAMTTTPEKAIKKRWSAEEINYLKTMAVHKTAKQIAYFLERSPKSVERKAQNLNISLAPRKVEWTDLNPTQRMFLVDLIDCGHSLSTIKQNLYPMFTIEYLQKQYNKTMNEAMNNVRNTF